MKFKEKLFIVLFILIALACEKEAKEKPVLRNNQVHPDLILTRAAVADIKLNLGNLALFDSTLEAVKTEVALEIKKGISVPLPKDMAGGFTHTQHITNYKTMQKAGVLFQLLEDEKYAIYIHDMLLKYAKMYPDLPLHPERRSYARGKIFWQCLNDSNWLVYTSQAYDCIYHWLTEEQRNYLNTTLFRPFADFLSVGSPQFFNRIHNHSTWGNVAVGMIGLVIDDDELVNRALYGLPSDSIDSKAKDNDGGFIKDREGKAGFLANLDQPFSPDGYYTEGPYYQRYAMYPFLIFAEALENKKPELKIFEYKDSILIKAVNVLLNLTDADGDFFPLNDGQKGMSYYTSSLVSAVDIAYYFGGRNPQLLSIAEKQNEVQLDATGLAIAKAIEEGKSKKFIKQSIHISDGARGDEGGIGILRYHEDHKTMELVFKYAAQGLSHGHYDKLSFSLYENGEEVMQDYGLSRFVNVEQKNGGGYLKENTTWAKQTIAHNTLIQDETSHFKGDFETGNKHHSEEFYFDSSDPDIQMVSAKEGNAYENSVLHRTMVMVRDSTSINPYIIDVMKVVSNQSHQYDLPYHYFGQIISTSFKPHSSKVLKPLGNSNGYQHLWKEAEGCANAESVQLTWLSNRKFYSITSATQKYDKLLLVRLGANDPEFNLRSAPAFIIRKNNSQNTVYASVIESHGTYDPVKEKADNAYSMIEKVTVAFDTIDYTAVSIRYKSGQTKILIISNKNASKRAEHTLILNDKVYKWTGVYYFNLK